MRSRTIISSLILTLTLVLSTKAQTNPALYGYFVYTIAKNVDWPAEYKSGDFIIGILGETPAKGPIMAMAAKKEISGRPMKVAQFDAVADIGKCQMLFIPHHLSDQIDSIIKALNGKPTLIMTEKDGMALKGSCINFVNLQGNKVGFEINKAAMEKANLKVSAELSKFATVL